MQTSNVLRRAHLPLAFASLIVAAACSSRSSNTTSAGPGGSSSTTSSSTGPATTGTGASGGAGGMGGSGCPAPCQTPPCVPGSGNQLAVDSATATVVDPTGAPISGLEIELCGLNLCTNPAPTDASGSVNIVTGFSQKLQQPAFKFGDGLTYPRLAIPITMSTSSFPNLVDVALPMGTPFTPGGTNVSGGVTLDIPAGDVVTVDGLNYPTPPASNQYFRAVQIPVSQESAVLMPSGLTVGILVGVAPLETTFCPAVGVSVPNTASWPAGTAVEFYLHGVDTLEVYSVYGGWTKVSDGQVSADGTTVSTAAGQGFPVLESFAVVEKQ